MNLLLIAVDFPSGLTVSTNLAQLPPKEIILVANPRQLIHRGLKTVDTLNKPFQNCLLVSSCLILSDLK